MSPEEYTRRWETRVTRTGPALRNEMRISAQRAVQLSRIKMRDEIYAKPEDISPSGKPKWVRTGHLLLSEQLREDSADTYVLTNSAPYAHRRHEANKPGFPHRVNDRDPDRTAHWRDDALEELQREQPERWARLLLEIAEGSL